MKNIRHYNGAHTPCSLSNLCFMGRCNAEELRLGLENTKTAEEFRVTATRMTKLEWSIVSDSKEEVVILYTDPLGNKNYIKGTKESTKLDLTHDELKLIDAALFTCVNTDVGRNFPGQQIDEMNALWAKINDFRHNKEGEQK